MKKKNRSLLLWLLLPLLLTADILFVWIGTRIDLALFANSQANGHGIPVFSALFLLMAAAATIIVFLLALALAIRSFRRRH